LFLQALPDIAVKAPIQAPTQQRKEKHVTSKREYANASFSHYFVCVVAGYVGRQYLDASFSGICG